MTVFILRRLLSIMVTFFVVSVIIFVMMHAIKGGPFDAGDMPMPPAVRDRIMAKYGLDQPIYVQ